MMFLESLYPLGDTKTNPFLILLKNLFFKEKFMKRVRPVEAVEI